MMQKVNRACPACDFKGAKPTRICLNNCHFRFVGQYDDAEETEINNKDGVTYGNIPFFSKMGTEDTQWVWLHYYITDSTKKTSSA